MPPGHYYMLPAPIKLMISITALVLFIYVLSPFMLTVIKLADQYWWGVYSSRVLGLGRMTSPELQWVEQRAGVCWAKPRPRKPSPWGTLTSVDQLRQMCACVCSCVTYAQVAAGTRDWLLVLADLLFDSSPFCSRHADFLLPAPVMLIISTDNSIIYLVFVLFSFLFPVLFLSFWWLILVRYCLFI